MIVKLEDDDQGNLLLPLPQDVIEKHNIKFGDELELDVSEDGSLIIKFPKKVTIDIELEDDLLIQLSLLAHERNITLNQLIQDILKEYLKVSRG